jgi:hypothetical protein
MTMTQVAAIDTAPASSQTAMVTMIERVALDPNASIEKLERMLDMEQRIQAQRAKAEHADAKASAMAQMPAIPMSGKGHNGRPYATLKDIVSVTRPVLARHGLSLTWDTRIDGPTITVTAILTHRNGHEERVSLPLPSDNSGSKNPVQAYGSTQTYGQRYTAQSILGLALGEDTEDDGAAAAARQTISAEQASALAELMERAGGDQSKFLAFFKVATIADLPVGRYGQADAMLRKKIADAGKKGAA